MTHYPGLVNWLIPWHFSVFFQPLTLPGPLTGLVVFDLWVKKKPIGSFNEVTNQLIFQSTSWFWQCDFWPSKWSPKVLILWNKDDFRKQNTHRNILKTGYGYLIWRNLLYPTVKFWPKNYRQSNQNKTCFENTQSHKPDLVNE